MGEFNKSYEEHLAKRFATIPFGGNYSVNCANEKL